MPILKVTSAVICLALLSTAATSASADTRWQSKHPRREQVNNRLANQNQRITAERKEGDLTHAQAQALRSSDKSIRAQERADAAINGSHITKAEQHTLNQELNANSQAIGR